MSNQRSKTHDYMDKLDELVADSVRIPLSNGKCIVDAVLIGEILADLRESLPVELRQAENIVKDRNTILTEARREAEIIVKNAEEKAKILVSEQEVLLTAQRYANAKVGEANKAAEDIVGRANASAAEILNNAKRQGTDIINNANQYSEDKIRETNEKINRALTETEGKVKDLRQSTNAYVDKALGEIERIMTGTLSNVKDAQAYFSTKKL